MSAETYIGHASRMMPEGDLSPSTGKTLIERPNFDLLCSPECAIRAEAPMERPEGELRRSHRGWKDREWVVPNLDNVECHRVGCTEYYSSSCQLVCRANPTR